MNKKGILRTIISILCALAIGIGASLVVSAQTQPIRVTRPTEPSARATPYAVNPTTVDITSLTIGGSNAPSATTATPGSGSRPIPTFSAISSPVWVTTPGNSVQVGNDITLYGIVDSRQGIKNSNNSETGSSIVNVYDDLYVAGNGVAEPGNLTFDGALIGNNAGANNQISGNLTVAGALSVGGNLTASRIGCFYQRRGSDLTPASSLTWTNGFISCDAGDTLVGCMADFTNSAGSSTLPTGSNGENTSTKIESNAAGDRCYAAVMRTSGASVTITPLASCFSPDASTRCP